MTSRIGDLLTQKLSLPKNTTQVIKHQNPDEKPPDKSGKQNEVLVEPGGCKTQLNSQVAYKDDFLNQLPRDKLQKI